MSSYKEAGVDKEEGYKTVDKIKTIVERTHNKNVLNGLGSFGAFFAMPKLENPVLVSGTDGVGTKLRIAIDSKKYNTIGQDCYAMCANDILCHGATPLFFLDYLACGKLDSDVAAEIISGIAKACEETGCALIGGETAEMPGMYKVGDYDVAGFCVGAVEKSKIIDGKSISDGDIIIGLKSSGFHSNGFSLVRKVYTNLTEIVNGQPISDLLLEPTRLYQKIIFGLLEVVDLKGIAHITGGGLIENLPRILPKNIDAIVDKSKIPVPELMSELQKRGKVAEEEMWGTFNMGIGMTLVIDKSQKEIVKSKLEEIGEEYLEIGSIEKGEGKLRWA